MGSDASGGADAAVVTTLIERLPPEARPHAARLLRQVAHDLGTPISTLVMEAFSARLLLDRIGRSPGEVLPVGAAETVSELRELCANLEHATAGVTAYVSALTGLALQGTGGGDDGESPPEGDDRGPAHPAG